MNQVLLARPQVSCQEADKRGQRWSLGCGEAPHPTAALFQTNTGSPISQGKLLHTFQNFLEHKTMECLFPIHSCFLSFKLHGSHYFSPKSYITVSNVTGPGDRSPDLGQVTERTPPDHLRITPNTTEAVEGPPPQPFALGEQKPGPLASLVHRCS